MGGLKLYIQRSIHRIQKSRRGTRETFAPHIGRLETQAVGRTECDLGLQRVVGGTGRVCVVRHTVELRVVDDEVFGESAVPDQPSALTREFIRCGESAGKTTDISVREKAAPVRIAPQIRGDTSSADV